MSLSKWTAIYAQSLYYMITGVLPLVAMPLFLEITGPKTDLWLVRMVGLLAAVIGLVLGMAAKQRRWSPEILILSMGAALSFAAIDITYVSLHRIGAVYLGDAAFELVLVVFILLKR